MMTLVDGVAENAPDIDAWTAASMFPCRAQSRHFALVVSVKVDTCSHMHSMLRMSH